MENIAEQHVEVTQIGPTSSLISLEMNIFGRNATIGVKAADREANFAEIVPLARELADRIVARTAESLSEQGTPVVCGKRCTACCRYLVPLSVPEVFRLTGELLDMPADDGSPILLSSIEAAKTIIESRPQFEGPGECPPEQAAARDFMEDVNGWYSALELDCPLLRDGICTVYNNRPLACREHIVTGSAAPCRPGPDYEPHVVTLPVSVLDCLAELAAELEGGEVESVMLPLALPWAQSNYARARRTWPAPMMVERFFEIVRQKEAAEEAVYSR